MAESIIVNEEEIEAHAGEIEEAVQGFEEKALSQPIKESTIAAYQNSREEFKMTQDIMVLFCTALNQDVEQIKNLNVAFREFDNRMGSINRT